MITTLQYYKDNNDIDLIDECYSEMVSEGIMSEDDATLYKGKPARSLWAYWRYTMLNCRDCEDSIARWKQRFKDRAYLLSEKYGVLFNAYEEIKGNGKLSEMYSTSTTTTHSDGTIHSGTNNDSEMTTENIPQYADASKGTWINNRQNTGAETVTDGTSSDDGTVEQKSALNMIPAEMIDKMRHNLFNPYFEYAEDFRTLFINFWADECPCGCGSL